MLALVAAVAICEALGWPFLVGPLQRGLSQSLARQVTFGAQGNRGVRIHLLGGVRITAATFEIAAPDWSQDPYMLRARNASLSLRYIDLWRAIAAARCMCDAC